MIRGMYAATAGMMTMLSRVQTISNNLANVNTPGFREDTLRLTSFPQQLMARLFSAGGTQQIGSAINGIVNESVATRFTQASLRQTDSPLDLAINGDGFFGVQTAQGVRYTRDGSFRRDGNNQLVTAQGDLVLSDAGTPITLPPGAVSVSPEGQIRVTALIDGISGPIDQPVARIGVFTALEPGQLRKTANNQFEDATGLAQIAPQPLNGRATVHQGFLENSNVDPARAMSDMMVAQRSYEASARMLQLQDDMTARAVSDLGRL
ncbi:MAG TPA: flagellar basal-body rod protein FlgF [Chloroflexota bacterium]|nr:flagellar basal-body rod protein FlgF [Chloroflexota bacterium]